MLLIQQQSSATDHIFCAVLAQQTSSATLDNILAMLAQQNKQYNPPQPPCNAGPVETS
jgi:hypothetical protein